MTNVQIRDVPDDVHRQLQRRAEAAGQSLQQYLSAQLALLAATPTTEELIERIGRRRKGTLPLGAARAALEAERARR
jgi:antitoxin FitA